VASLKKLELLESLVYEKNKWLGWFPSLEFFGKDFIEVGKFNCSCKG